MQEEEASQSITLRMKSYYHSLFRPNPAPGPQMTIVRDFLAFDRIPKRVGSELTLSDHHPEFLKGWGVEVVEDFRVSWEISVAIALVCLAFIGLAVGLARKNHNLAYLAVAGLPLPLIGLFLTLYITAGKDNKA